MKIAIIQLNADSNKQNNIQNACNLVNEASNKNVDLILLPEVFNYRGPLVKRDLYQKIAEENKKSKFYDVLTSKFSDPLNKERKPVFINIDRLA